jgi:5-methylcytosine-specific restriction endonuclease McrA
MVEGKVGSGKSWLGMSIGEMTDPDFDIDRIVFSGIELMELINSGKLKKGSFILFEEVGVAMDAAKWQSTVNQMMKSLFETFRHRNFILFMNAPYMDYVAKGQRILIDGVFKTVSIDRVKKTCKVKPMLLQYNSRYAKMYYKYLRVRGPDGYAPIRNWSVPKPSDELIDKYEKKKRGVRNMVKKKGVSSRQDRIAKQLLSDSAFECVYCKCNNVLLATYDHKNASTDGGVDHYQNLQKCCYICNQLKDSMSDKQFKKYFKNLQELKELGMLRLSFDFTPKLIFKERHSDPFPTRNGVITK